MKEIAFDLGASSGKMMLGEFDGEYLHTQIVHRFSNRQILVNGDLYWNLFGIWKNLGEGIKKARQAAAGPIESLGIDTFCNDFGLIGRQGDLVSQMRCYRDQRMERRAKEIYQLLSPWELHRLTGNQNALFNTSIQLAAMILEGEGYLLENCDTLLHLPDLLNYMLTGEKRSEYTIASVSQMYDYASEGWHREVLRKFGIPERILADVIDPGTEIGRIKEDTALNMGVEKMKVVAVGEHDTASAVAALPITQKDVAYISSGTWSLMGIETDHPIVNLDTFHSNIAIEGGVERRYRMLKNIMGLWLVQECRMEYAERGEEYSFEDLGRLAANAAPFRSLIDPDDGEFYKPGDMLKKIRRFCERTEQPLPETPGQFIRAIDESLAMKYRWVLEILERVGGRKINSIYILGGGGLDVLLDQFTANACGRPVYAGPTEAALFGNLLMQLKAKGEIRDISQGREILAKSVRIKSFQPDQQSLWNEKYQYFQTLLNHS